MKSIEDRAKQYGDMVRTVERLVENYNVVSNEIRRTLSSAEPSEISKVKFTLFRTLQRNIQVALQIYNEPVHYEEKQTAEYNCVTGEPCTVFTFTVYIGVTPHKVSITLPKGDY